MFQTSENKNTERVLDTYYVNNDYANVKKFMKLASNSTLNRLKTQKAQIDKKTSFPKKSVENANFYKLVLNKIMTTYE